VGEKGLWGTSQETSAKSLSKFSGKRETSSVARQTVQGNPATPVAPVTPATSAVARLSAMGQSDVAQVAAQKVRRSASIASSTPGRFRLVSAGLLLALLSASTVGWVFMNRRQHATIRLGQNTAPAVLAVERVRSSLAEADSAASTNFLVANFGDRQQARIYENALGRVSTSLEDASRRIGNDDKSHELIALLGRKTVTYASLVEGAKTELLASGSEKAAIRLQNASAYLVSDVEPTIRELTKQSAKRFAADEGNSTSFAGGIPVFFGIALLALLFAQVFLSKRTKRTLNLPLLIATAVLVVSIAATLVASTAANKDVRLARENALIGIERLSNFRVEAYLLQGTNNRGLIAKTGVAGNLAASNLTTSEVDSIDQVSGLLGAVRYTFRDPVGRQLTEELIVRWTRYRNTLVALEKLTPDAQAKSATSLNEQFTGMNVSLDSVLANDEVSFLDGYKQAKRRTQSLPWVLLLGALAAALLSMIGFQRRISEYR
jgi:uncharacterized protein (UPF0333 family)